MKGIAKFLSHLALQLQVAWEPQLIPVRVGGVIIDWIDVRTGQKAWFS